VHVGYVQLFRFFTFYNDAQLRHGSFSISGAPITSPMHSSVYVHWLHVPERIQFKIAVLTYRVLHGDTPHYLGPFTSTADFPGWWALRSAGTKRLVVPSDFLLSAAELFWLLPLKSGTFYQNTSSQLPRYSFQASLEIVLTTTIFLHRTLVDFVVLSVT